MATLPTKASPPYRHAAIYSTGRPRCPVCNKDVYSRSGIHPQCAAFVNEKKPTAPAVPLAEPAITAAPAEVNPRGA